MTLAYQGCDFLLYIGQALTLLYLDVDAAYRAGLDLIATPKSLASDKGNQEHVILILAEC